MKKENKMKKTLSILLVTVATLTMAACGNTTTEKLPHRLAQKQVKRRAQRRLIQLTVKTYDAKGNEVEQVFDKAPEKLSPTIFQQLKSYWN